MLSYLVNTLIFTVVGLVIAIRAFSGVEDTDWLYLVALYFGISAIRYFIYYIIEIVSKVKSKHYRVIIS